MLLFMIFTYFTSPKGFPGKSTSYAMSDWQPLPFYIFFIAPQCKYILWGFLKGSYTHWFYLIRKTKNFPEITVILLAI